MDRNKEINEVIGRPSRGQFVSNFWRHVSLHSDNNSSCHILLMDIYIFPTTTIPSKNYQDRAFSYFSFKKFVKRINGVLEVHLQWLPECEKVKDRFDFQYFTTKFPNILFLSKRLNFIFGASPTFQVCLFLNTLTLKYWCDRAQMIWESISVNHFPSLLIKILLIFKRKCFMVESLLRYTRIRFKLLFRRISPKGF